MVNPLIVGFGHAGIDLHFKSLKELWLSKSHKAPVDLSKVGIVDPRYQPQDTEGFQFRDMEKDGIHLSFLAGLQEASAHFVPANTVVHICTPPESHLELISEAAAYNYRKIIVEKPMATTTKDIDTILEMERKFNLDILIVINWLSSNLTHEITRVLDAKAEISGITSAEFRQVKPRLTRSLAKSDHLSAFDVEMPHLAALCLYLGGFPAKLIEATCDDIVLDKQRVKYMGGAKMSVELPGGYTAHLITDLTAPTRERSIKIEWSDNSSLEAYYPCYGDDQYSQIRLYDENRKLTYFRFIEDNTLMNFFFEAYRYFESGISKPHSDTSFNATVCSMLAEAKSRCGIYQAVPTGEKLVQ